MEAHTLEAAGQEGCSPAVLDKAAYTPAALELQVPGQGARTRVELEEHILDKALHTLEALEQVALELVVHILEEQGL